MPAPKNKKGEKEKAMDVTGINPRGQGSCWNMGAFKADPRPMQVACTGCVINASKRKSCTALGEGNKFQEKLRAVIFIPGFEL